MIKRKSTPGSFRGGCPGHFFLKPKPASTGQIALLPAIGAAAGETITHDGSDPALRQSDPLVTTRFSTMPSHPVGVTGILRREKEDENSLSRC